MTHLLTVLALIAGYAVFVLIWPDMACGKCSGWGHKARRRRSKACGRCKGTGRQSRPGARVVHKGAAMAIRYIREKREGGR
jgi:hypothetical protein